METRHEPPPVTPLLGILTGLASEAATLGAADPRVAIALSAARRERAEAEVARLAGLGVRALLSVGIAGGLDPALAPGARVVPARVCDTAGRTWATAFLAGTGTLAGVDAAVTTPGGKAALRAGTGAVAVDMESHVVARAAAAAGLPFAVLRVVADPADRAIPAAALNGVGPDGTPRLWPVIAGLLRRPQDLPGLLALRRDYAAALAALEAAAAELIPPLLAAIPRR